jgi:hypothetical protein
MTASTKLLVLVHARISWKGCIKVLEDPNAGVYLDSNDQTISSKSRTTNASSPKRYAQARLRNSVRAGNDAHKRWKKGLAYSVRTCRPLYCKCLSLAKLYSVVQGDDKDALNQRFDIRARAIEARFKFGLYADMAYYS